MFRWISLFAFTVIVCLFAFQPNQVESKPQPLKFKTVWTPKFTVSYCTPIDERYFTQTVVRRDVAPQNAIEFLPKDRLLNAYLRPGEMLQSDDVWVGKWRSHIRCPSIPQGFKVIGIHLENIDERTGLLIGVHDWIDVIGRVERVEEGTNSKGEAIVANRVCVFSVRLPEIDMKEPDSKPLVGLFVAESDAEEIFKAIRNDWQLSMTLHRD